MTLDQLITFLWVSRLGGVRRAAQEMNISQPAVSGRIAALEQSLGTRLFDRAQRGVTLTKKGVLLRDYSEKILDLVEGIKADIIPAEAEDSLLRVGVAETIVQLWLPKFLSALYESYPKIRVEIVVDVSVNLRQQLLERNIDLALLMGPISDYTVDNIDLPKVALTWFKPAGRPDPDLRHSPVVTYNRNSRPYRDLRRQMIDRYGHSTQLFPTSSIHAGLEMVATGIGVGLFPHQFAEQFVKQGRIAPFDPGWKLDDLGFTASFLGDPRNELCARAANIAVACATNYLKE
ncbi:LysR family transcriptional regulator [Citreicella sp. C3M06]|uniref:LysR family transcriptional regulator n=1 Tax=Roseobacteraceae TaxID=2854170 RepID=UPI001C0A14DD|nr:MULTISPECIES: LysR family transcriptional regulator [Roseobacteraceae]MBU2960296.1 LysR family transcriptional regulator [Citreicella sp. C3M06]MDO6588346.1 LysR family transcriptional regulator [Salipiger sp. 1_MG-2023]